MSWKRRGLTAGAMAVAAVTLSASPALGYHCTNVSKDQAAGAKLLFRLDEVEGLAIVRSSKSFDAQLAARGFDAAFNTLHGWVAVDLDGDLVGDVGFFWAVGPDGVLPSILEDDNPNAALCTGITDVGTAFANDCITLSAPPPPA